MHFAIISTHGAIAQFGPKAHRPLDEARAFMFFVYFAKSLKNGKIYVGRSEKSPAVRVEEHNLGSNTWTRQNGPFKLVYYESYICKEDSVQREQFYKTGTGKKVKLAICRDMEL